MKDLSQNNLVRFVNVSRKKEGLFANFKVKVLRGGAMFTATITVDFAAADVSAADPLERIIEECARIAVKEYKKTEPQFEGLVAV